MDAPLWIDRHQPDLAALPQAEVRRYLRKVPSSPTNLMLFGPVGSGKTAAVRALGRELHASPAHDQLTINVADFFGMTKNELIEDPRFRGFIQPAQRRDSKAALVNHVLQEMAGYPPVSGQFKTIVLDNAEAMREDFQQALRRVMERHYEATQFVLCTRSSGAVIDPIRSRCVQIPMRAPTTTEIVTVLRQIAEAEDVTYDEDGLAYIAESADGNLRRAILSAQATAVGGDEITADAAYETLDGIGSADRIRALLDHAEAGTFEDARSSLDDLFITDGYEGEELLIELLRAARARYEPEELAGVCELAGDIEFDMVRGTNDRVHLAHFLARLNPTIEASSAR